VTIFPKFQKRQKTKTIQMKQTNRPVRAIVSGGGTGGHIFPALSIARALQRRLDAEILFVGAENRMEMEKVPAAGFKIVGLPVAGFDRKHLFRNISVLKKLYRSIHKAKKVIRDFKPDICIGVGGYASGPVLKSAQKMGIPTLLQEQNSYAGVTNKLLARKAKCICTAYEGMERFFPADRIVLTGNPIRKELSEVNLSPAEARKAFGMEPDKPTVLVVGGSLGARTVNEAMEKEIERLLESGLQVIWQTGKNFGDRAIRATQGKKGVVVSTFISDMGKAYAAADLVVSRAGAGSISELELLGKPCILVPSPNVAEDHQTKNAMALAGRGAAVLIPDAEAVEKLGEAILSITPEKRRNMHENILKMALPDSDERIIDEVEKILNT